MGGGDHCQPRCRTTHTTAFHYPTKSWLPCPLLPTSLLHSLTHSLTVIPYTWSFTHLLSVHWYCYSFSHSLFIYSLLTDIFSHTLAHSFSYSNSIIHFYFHTHTYSRPLQKRDAFVLTQSVVKVKEYKYNFLYHATLGTVALLYQTFK